MQAVDVSKETSELFVVLISSSAMPAAKSLDMYVVNTEGGKAFLIITPSGQSILVDAGLPGFNDRDPIRIEEAAKAAGIKKFDFLGRLMQRRSQDHVFH
jgi:competence protein ComEC